MFIPYLTSPIEPRVVTIVPFIHSHTVPVGIKDEIEMVKHFKEEFRNRYCEIHMPAFQIDSLENIFLKAKSCPEREVSDIKFWNPQGKKRNEPSHYPRLTVTSTMIIRFDIDYLQRLQSNAYVVL